MQLKYLMAERNIYITIECDYGRHLIYSKTRQKTLKYPSAIQAKLPPFEPQAPKILRLST
jgi:hypothetical protein